MDLLAFVIVLAVVALALGFLQGYRGTGLRQAGANAPDGVTVYDDPQGHFRIMRFVPPKPKGYRIFESAVPVVGISFRHDAALAFARGPGDQAVELDPEPQNPHDPNAIRVIGTSGGRRHVLGYLPKELAEDFAKTGLVPRAVGRLREIYCGSRGKVDVTLDVLGPNDSFAQYQAHLGSLPADEDQVAFLRFFKLPVARGLTIDQARAKIAEHKSALGPEQLREWEAYEQIRETFDDPDERESMGVKKVSRSALDAAIESLKAEGNTLPALADEPDTIAEKILEAHPELERA